MVDDRGGTAGATLAAPGGAYAGKADAEPGEGSADFGSAAVSSSQLFLLLCGAGTLLRSWCQYGVGKWRGFLCTSRDAVGPECLLLLLGWVSVFEVCSFCC